MQEKTATRNTTGQRISTRKMAVAGMLGAVAIVLSVTGLGMIPMPTLAGRATIMHVPVILAAILEGPVVGAFTGFIFGLYSFMTPVGAIPADPIVRILPRILIGVTSYYTFVLFRRSNVGAAAAAIERPWKVTYPSSGAVNVVIVPHDVMDASVDIVVGVELGMALCPASAGVVRLSSSR